MTSFGIVPTGFDNFNLEPKPQDNMYLHIPIFDYESNLGDNFGANVYYYAKPRNIMGQANTAPQDTLTMTLPCRPVPRNLVDQRVKRPAPTPDEAGMIATQGLGRNQGFGLGTVINRNTNVDFENKILKAPSSFFRDRPSMLPNIK